MALMACPSCNKHMSNKADVCPHCAWSREGAVGVPENAVAARAVVRRKAMLNNRLQMLGMVGVVAFAAGGWFWVQGLTSGRVRDGQLGQWSLAIGFVTYVFARGWILWNRHGDKFSKR